jgi:hypothetical protein
MDHAEECRREIDKVRSEHGNWLRAADHAKALSPKAGALRRVLDRQEFTQRAAEYGTESDAASQAQTSQKRLGWRAAFFGFLATILSSVMLLAPELPTGSVEAIVTDGTTRILISTDINRFLFNLVMAAHFICLAIAATAFGLISFFQLNKSWGQARSAAESKRIAQFDALFNAREASGADEWPLALLALEYTRVFLLVDQRDWFLKRSREFRRAVVWGNVWRALSVLLVLFATLPALVAYSQIVPETSWHPWIADFRSWFRNQPLLPILLPLLGIIGASLQSLMTSLAAISLSERNANTYGRMVLKLDDILGKPLEEARLAAVSGDRSGLDRFWYDLRLELMSENRAWESTLTATQQQILDGLVPNVADR